MMCKRLVKEDVALLESIVFVPGVYVHIMAQYMVALAPIELLQKNVWCWQESPGGDDFRASPTEVLLGVSGWKVGGPECQTGGASRENDSAGAKQ